MQSPQAVLPEIRTTSDYIREAVRQGKYIVDPPRIITAAGVVFEKEDGVAIRTLQNVGDTPVYYKVCESVDDGDMEPANEDSDPTADVNHGVIAAGAAVDDGLGSVVDFSKYKGKIRIAAVAGIGSGAIKLVPFQARDRAAR